MMATCITCTQCNYPMILRDPFKEAVIWEATVKCRMCGSEYKVKLEMTKMVKKGVLNVPDP